MPVAPSPEEDTTTSSEGASLTSQGTLAEGGLVELKHELSGPMMVIRWNLEVARAVLEESEEVGADQRERLREAVEAAIQGMDHASRMVRSWRGQRGSQERRMRVDVGALVERVVRMTRGWLEERAEVTLALPEAPLVVEGVETRLRQVLFNLLDNAYHAIRPEQRAEQSIAVGVREQDRQVVIEVRDSGAGIAPELVKQLGEPFVSARPGGTGLGLNLCSEIVWEHGGRLELESEVDSGTTVRVWLPRAGEGTEPPIESATREMPTVKPPRGGGSLPPSGAQEAVQAPVREPRAQTEPSPSGGTASTGVLAEAGKDPSRTIPSPSDTE